MIESSRMALLCHACGRDLDMVGAVGRRDACLHCGVDLHACVGCVAFEPTTSKQCREPFADPPVSKTDANACEFFIYARDRAPGKGRPSAARDDALRRLEDLFKKK